LASQYADLPSLLKGPSQPRRHKARAFLLLAVRPHHQNDVQDEGQGRDCGQNVQNLRSSIGHRYEGQLGQFSGKPRPANLNAADN
jgi:hypothetical protein